jgi:hypothetical protein
MRRISSTFSVGFMPAAGSSSSSSFGSRGQGAHDLQPALVTVRQALGRVSRKARQLEDPSISSTCAVMDASSS